MTVYTTWVEHVEDPAETGRTTVAPPDQAADLKYYARLTDDVPVCEAACPPDGGHGMDNGCAKALPMEVILTGEVHACTSKDGGGFDTLPPPGGLGWMVQ